MYVCILMNCVTTTAFCVLYIFCMCVWVCVCGCACAFAISHLLTICVSLCILLLFNNYIYCIINTISLLGKLVWTTQPTQYCLQPCMRAHNHKLYLKTSRLFPDPEYTPSISTNVSQLLLTWGTICKNNVFFFGNTNLQVETFSYIIMILLK